MKHLLTIIFLSFYCCVQSQNGFSVLLNTSAGYEHNVFNRYKSENILSSPFLSNSIKISWKRKIRKTKLAVYARGRNDIFYTTHTANLRKASLYLTSKYDMNSSSSIFTDGQISSNNSNRTLDESEFFLSTSSYDKWRYRIGIKSRTKKKTKTSLSLYISEKKYHDNRSLFNKYREYGCSIKSYHKLWRSSRTTHSIQSEFNLFQRDYFKTTTTGHHEDDLHNQTGRLFRYLEFKLTFSSHTRNILSCKPSLFYRKRTDIYAGRFSYYQWEPGLDLTYSIKDFELDINFAYTFRSFHNIQAEDNNEQKLELEYMNLSSTVIFSVTKCIQLKLLGVVRFRERNITNDNVSIYLPYRNWHSSIGFTYNI